MEARCIRLLKGGECLPEEVLGRKDEFFPSHALRWLYVSRFLSLVNRAYAWSSLSPSASARERAVQSTSMRLMHSEAIFMCTAHYAMGRSELRSAMTGKPRRNKEAQEG
jgi:hypothetical protein